MKIESYDLKTIYHNKYQFLRFLITGFFNTIVGIAAFYILYLVGLPYWAATLGSLIIGIINNFFTYRKFVFTLAKESFFYRYCLMYFSLYFIGLYCRNILFSYGIDDKITYLILFLPTIVAAYFLSKFFVFPANKEIAHD